MEILLKIINERNIYIYVLMFYFHSQSQHHVQKFRGLVVGCTLKLVAELEVMKRQPKAVTFNFTFVEILLFLFII